MRSIRSIALILIGAAAIYGLQDVVEAARFGAFENPNPSLFSKLAPLWTVLLIIFPGTLIGLIAGRWATVLSAAAYLIGFLSHFLYHYGEWNQPPEPISALRFTLKDCLAVLLVGAIGALVAFCVALAKSRLPIGSSDRGVSPSVNQGEGP